MDAASDVEERTDHKEPFDPGELIDDEELINYGELLNDEEMIDYGELTDYVEMIDDDKLKDNEEHMEYGEGNEDKELVDGEEFLGVGDVTDAQEGEVDDMTMNDRYRGHRLYRQRQELMFGIVGRKWTALSSFSPYYNTLCESYEALTADDVDGDLVVKELLKILSSETEINDHQVQTPLADVKIEANRLWEEYLHTLPDSCPWVTGGNHSKKPCVFNLAADAAPQAHVYRHLLHSKRLICNWGICGERFGTREALYEHAYSRHGIFPNYSPDSNSLFTWCRYCRQYIYGSKYSTQRKAHFESHLQKALLDTKQYGYRGVILNAPDAKQSRECIAPQCIIDLHDQTKSAEDRISHNTLDRTSTNLIKHLYVHFKQMNLTEHYYCPASPAASANFPLCSYSFPDHMQKVHYVVKFP